MEIVIGLVAGIAIDRILSKKYKISISKKEK